MVIILEKERKTLANSLWTILVMEKEFKEVEKD